MRRALILGSGFTGSRVARLLREEGIEVIAANRSGSAGLALDVEHPSALDTLAGVVVPGTVVLHSIPVPGLMPLLRRLAPARVVYLSTTGVYGPQRRVDETTPVAPQSESERVRVVEENMVFGGPWSSLVLRPAAIYGPGRGVHASMRAGKYFIPGDGSNFVSRIYVDDLARIAAAAMSSNFIGAYPVADDHPCTSREIAEYCSRLLNLPTPNAMPLGAVGHTSRADRRVDGSAIRCLLGIELLYPTYRDGIPACLAEEARAFSTS